MVLITVLELLKIQKLLYLNPYYRSAYNIPKRRK